MKDHNAITRPGFSPKRLAAAAVAAGAAGLLATQATAASHGHAYRSAHRSDEPLSVVAQLQGGALSVQGTARDDKLALRLKAGDPATLQVDAGDDGSAEFEFPRAAVTRIAVDAGRGNDSIRVDEANGVFTDTIPTTLDGGPGDDTIAGGSGAERLLGGSGNDRIDGNKGNDRSDLGAGDDTFVWDPGDGSDSIEGQDGYDTMLFNGAAAAEHVDLSANGNRLRFFRDVASITMDTAGVEQVDFNALGGADVVTVHDLSGTDVQNVNVDESSPAGSGTGDGAADQVIVEGTAGSDRIAVSGSNGAARVAGLSATVNVSGAEPARDTLTIDALDGNDSVVALRLAASAVGLAVDGGDGSDLLIGGAGDDHLSGSAGNDVLIGGGGQDVLDGGPGNNIVIQ